MGRFQSRINQNSESFQANQADMLALNDQVVEIVARAATLSAKRNPVFAKRGQLPPRERLGLLLDPGMPFLTLYRLANYLVEDPDPETSVGGASVIAGIGYVSGVRCMIWVDDSGIRAGSMTQKTMPVCTSILDIALKQKLPLIHLVESAGADLTSFTVENWAGSGGMFKRLAHLSAAGIPTFVILHGASTAGGAYMPGMSDYVIGVKNTGLAALAGPALVKSATGEETDARELGGSEMHASVSGLVEYLAENDKEAITTCRELVGRLGWNERADIPDRKPFSEPIEAIDDVMGIVPVDYKKPFDAREVIVRIVDGSDITEFKPGFGPGTICLNASIMGRKCAVISNNAPIDPEGAMKAAQFIQLSDQSGTPLIFLHNTTGYIVGTDSEQAGMIKHGAKMIQAVANVRVPKLSIYMGASFGAGNYGMCGYAYDPDFLFAWPNAQTNVMGADTAAKTMKQVFEAKAARKGETVNEDELQAEYDRIQAHFSRQESAFYTAGRLLCHDIIDPRDTRQVLGFCLETVIEARHRTLKPNSFGVSRF